ncbi:uncharacterized protein MELLADRAFT_67282 [Melampsora larici-populina 98AG31]|uniref:Uncharacterized protein n=1 Tax=Melampsora larici-populina (strain 98AG31 / pathotype 3-4-7) TaxID=747676 RepID=F4S2I3_MELLP|nr:uncharacterized protein MELLADRAFT_67282 [Melampsora larici-populina 98AG31]EGG01184.1 hypothetical protein MELLADRAFT_67282 [Melampsora larici-populina 98AG31]
MAQPHQLKPDPHPTATRFLTLYSGIVSDSTLNGAKGMAIKVVMGPHGALTTLEEGAYLIHGNLIDTRHGHSHLFYRGSPLSLVDHIIHKPAEAIDQSIESKGTGSIISADMDNIDSEPVLLLRVRHCNYDTIDYNIVTFNVEYLFDGALAQQLASHNALIGTKIDITGHVIDRDKARGMWIIKCIDD